MNLEYLFEIQAGLDAHIEEEHPRQEGEDRLAKKILALQVELGELANEWRGFKFWKVNQQPVTFERLNKKCTKCKGMGRKVINPGTLENKLVDCDICVGGWQYKNPLLEEYVDCLHFILSIGLELNRTDDALPYVYIYSPNASADEIIGQFGHVMKNTWNVHGDYFNLINSFIELGSMLGFTWEQVEQAYMEKNKINHERQVNGY